jgi:hypothetical protein
MVDCKSQSKLKKSSAQMVKRGSELAGICRYQGIVGVKKRKLMRDSKLDRTQWTTRSNTCTCFDFNPLCRFHDALALPMFSKPPITCVGHVGCNLAFSDHKLSPHTVHAGLQ